MTVQTLVPAHPISLRSRLIGFGSVFGKSVRDSRRAFIIAALFLGVFQFLILTAVSSLFATHEASDEIVALANQMGAAAQGMAGNPVNIGTIGGYVSWKYGSVFTIFAAMWSILALSGTLAGEARRGSLDILAASPLSKRRIAVEKLSAHLTLIALIVAIQTLAAWLGGMAAARLPGDEISFGAAFGFALWIGLMAIAFGSLAFVVAQYLGRAAAVGIAGGSLVAGWIINGYQASVPALRPLAALTPWSWTYNHVPLAGQYDWVSLIPLAIIPIVLFPLGIEVFARRDLGAASALPLPGMPSIAVGLRGPAGRSFGERLPLAIAWGLGMGAFGLVLAAASRSLADSFANSPDVVTAIQTVFPSFATSAGGFLQLMTQIMFIVVGLAAATLVSGWASDETTGRLEMVLATPLARARWAISTGIGMFGAVTVMTAIIAAGFAIGAALAGSDALTPLAGTLALGLFALAATGVGLAIGGMFRTSVAAEIVALLVVVTYLIDLLSPLFKLPDWVRQLALTSHMGRPMIGEWDLVGVVACLALALGGMGLGAWGIARRDVES
jgi:ABC-2 type transport system permease protein